MSDTHGLHGRLGRLPDGDLLIHCGDATNDGSWAEFQTFWDWFVGQPHERKIFVPGNHDLCLATTSLPDDSIPSTAHVLRDSAVAIPCRGGKDWIHVFGTSAHKRVGSWPFGLDEEEAVRFWTLANPRADIVVTHGPAYGANDEETEGEKYGCPAMRDWMEEVRRTRMGPPILHLHGHIHESLSRVTLVGDVVSMNCSVYPCTPNRPPVVVDI